MNEVSIIINGVRYDAVETDTEDWCYDCDLYEDCKLADCCGDLIDLNQVFKKSTKSFER